MRAASFTARPCSKALIKQAALHTLAAYPCQDGNDCKALLDRTPNLCEGDRMEPLLHSTADYHRRRIESLGWELTVCNMLEPRDSPCRSILTTKSSYGHLLYDFLARRVPMENARAVIEIGGGYGCLMRDFLERNPALSVAMLDISPALLERQRETLRGRKVEWRNEDFLSSDPQTFSEFDLAILNEILGDFPVVTNLGVDDLSPDAFHVSEEVRAVRRLFDRYGIPKPDAELFSFHIGAVRATEKLCAAGVPRIFIGEHSCEATFRRNRPLVRSRSGIGRSALR